MTQRIAPNNQFEAECFIQFFRIGRNSFGFQSKPIKQSELYINNDYTYAIFRIRQNKLTTKHKFNK